MIVRVKYPKDIGPVTLELRYDLISPLGAPAVFRFSFLHWHFYGRIPHHPVFFPLMYQTGYRFFPLWEARSPSPPSLSPSRSRVAASRRWRWTALTAGMPGVREVRHPGS
jgi:hypothetical protein